MYAVLGRGARPTRAKGITRWKLTASKAVGLDPAMETKVACTSTSGGFDRRLAQPILQGVPVQLDALAGIGQVSLTAELIHIVSHNLTGRSHVLRKQFVRERNHLHRAILGCMAEPLGETDEGSRETPVATQFVYGAALSVFLALWFTVVAVFFTTRSMRSAFDSLGHWINRVTGLVFIALGVRIALQRAG